MYEAKTKETDKSVVDFIESIDNEKKKKDAYRLLKIFEEATGFKPVIWGTSIIGFGKYHYKYKSGHEGEAPLAGFSPRKSKISLYLLYESEERDKLLENFGKHKKGKGCVYINKVDDIDIEVLKALIKLTVKTFQNLFSDE
jgi:hypothetical protein